MAEPRPPTRDPQELSPLTDSLTSCIRWRLSDYEAMLRGEVELLLTAPQRDTTPAAIERDAR